MPVFPATCAFVQLFVGIMHLLESIKGAVVGLTYAFENYVDFIEITLLSRSIFYFNINC